MGPKRRNAFECIFRAAWAKLQTAVVFTMMKLASSKLLDGYMQ